MAGGGAGRDPPAPLHRRRNPGDPSEVLVNQVVANACRKELPPIEQALAYRRIMELKGCSAAAVAEMAGVNRATVSRSLALLDLPEELVARVEAGDLAPSIAYEISKVEDPDDRERIAKETLLYELKRADVAGRVACANKPKPEFPVYYKRPFLPAVRLGTVKARGMPDAMNLAPRTFQGDVPIGEGRSYPVHPRRLVVLFPGTTDESRSGPSTATWRSRRSTTSSAATGIQARGTRSRGVTSRWRSWASTLRPSTPCTPSTSGPRASTSRTPTSSGSTTSATSSCDATEAAIKALRKRVGDVRKCRSCGCTEDDCKACIEKTGQPCRWIEPDLCSACRPEAAESPAGGAYQVAPGISIVRPARPDRDESWRAIPIEDLGLADRVVGMLREQGCEVAEDAWNLLDDCTAAELEAHHGFEWIEAKDLEAALLALRERHHDPDPYYLPVGDPPTTAQEPRQGDRGVPGAKHPAGPPQPALGRPRPLEWAGPGVSKTLGRRECELVEFEGVRVSVQSIDPRKPIEVLEALRVAVARVEEALGL